MSVSRQMRRKTSRQMIGMSKEAVNSLCDVKKGTAVAEAIVSQKISTAIEELTRKQVIHEMRVAGCISGVWMLALKDVFGFHSKRLMRVYERVNDMLTYMNTKKGEQNVQDVIDAVADECEINIEVPNGINDNRPLLLGGRSICYGPLLGTVQFMGEEVEIKAETVGIAKISGDGEMSLEKEEKTA